MIRHLVFWIRVQWINLKWWWRRRGATPLRRKPGRSLPEGHQWRGHCGTKAQLRTLRQRWERVKKLDDPESRRTRDRLWTVASSRPDARFVAMVLSHAALQAAEASGAPWSAVMGRMLDNYERAEGKIA